MVTVIIIVITAAVSLLCFYGGGFDALKFNAYQVWHQKQWYRLFSYGFVHSGWGHLFFNMLTLYFFGGVVEKYFAAAFGSTTGVILYVVLYTTALVVSTIGDLIKYRNDFYYNAVGASGAVSAILFASILFEPKMGIYIYLIPIPVPGFIFAPLYLLYCWYMARRNADNIGHSAHFWGAVYGLLFPLACKPEIFSFFISQLQ
ncbi:MAG: rhomboid family intramembrane serine protease [Bacteroidales bacterium]|nr:rhomboid family intramembrane serine protease [Bacteroidales bacterium]MBR6247167.1 rhomboid family intramembrane serine protease [Bacteroidales bacterium]